MRLTENKFLMKNVLGLCVHTKNRTSKIQAMWFDLNSEIYFLISSESNYPKNK